MTNEEAIARIREHKIIHKMNEPRAIYISEALDMAIKALEQQICDNDCEHCDWATCPKMEEETETITVSKGCLKARKGRFVVYDVEYLKKHIDREAEIYRQSAAECDDCISRQKAIDAIDALYLDGDSSISYLADAKGDTLIGKYQAITTLDDLPPVNLAEKKQPCEDCISREKVKQFLYERLDRLNDDELYDIFSRIIDDMYNELPSVSPKPKTGHWIETYSEIDAKYSRHSYKCSECGELASYFVGGSEDWWDLVKPNYCPNCGVKMEEGEE